ncbi:MULTISPECIES: flagellar hook-basal body complex protein FliE [unclassified Simplicispira]|uniref:flagellar hook-basal body complex protein FliE n=1 Tax=unclassified Simplicispira TaxID=2630407 RepID=UPI0008C88837|nr:MULTISPECIES: flagellar hook-basal body complex protein FliE [unclassified Simplicispira]OGA88750.1 MAG: flagellar hook-basal body complex protein FliE [Burkholderiales bacterium RIFCSPHIGHO2_12_63_9]OGB47267.1 MAG: flagellar hook-basal body complex protein FliE [Burkholderiales bacterium RIFCSPLOWO2_12_FULL_65_40]PVY57428.1 flagellar hook-basal body complex protein FliE [Simplicispira sp. 125]REG18372.1 flagellar hook-basal body complex protein FliE [Simplicispira sp. 110]
MNITTNPLGALLPVNPAGTLPSKAPTVQDRGFLDVMKQALTTTSQLQSESGRLSREVTLGNPTVSLEETMFAGVKSNIAFQATLHTRNRLVQAYTDVMNIQV